jgi:intracellular sulfur oxidation DsrE/DsrF family protein
MLKAVVHVNFGDADRQKHGLTNVTNMLKVEGGKAEIVVVCHGPGIALVVKDKSPDAAEVERLIKDGVKFEACENTLRDKGIPKESLIPGATTVPGGAARTLTATTTLAGRGSSWIRCSTSRRWMKSR